MMDVLWCCVGLCVCLCCLGELWCCLKGCVGANRQGLGLGHVKDTGSVRTLLLLRAGKWLGLGLGKPTRNPDLFEFWVLELEGCLCDICVEIK